MFSQDFNQNSQKEFSKFFANSFQLLYTNKDFQNVIFSQDLKRALSSQDFEDVMVKFANLNSVSLLANDENDVRNAAEFQSSIGAWSMSENLNMFFNSNLLKSSSGAF